MDESKIYLCRCEDITLEDLHKMLDQGMTSMEEIKRKSRCCKGPCQGRTCRELIAKEISSYLGTPMGELDIPTFRPPLKPISLGAIAKGDE